MTVNIDFKLMAFLHQLVLELSKNNKYTCLLTMGLVNNNLLWDIEINIEILLIRLSLKKKLLNLFNSIVDLIIVIIFFLIVIQKYYYTFNLISIFNFTPMNWSQTNFDYYFTHKIKFLWLIQMSIWF